jgi:hypothetical protein
MLFLSDHLRCDSAVRVIIVGVKFELLGVRDAHSLGQALLFQPALKVYARIMLLFSGRGRLKAGIDGIRARSLAGRWGS